MEKNKTKYIGINQRIPFVIIDSAVHQWLLSGEVDREAILAGLKTQSQISKIFISARMASLYGTNRTVDIALDALIPMIIELGAIQRDKTSIYSAAHKSTLSTAFTIELVIYTDIRLSGSKSLMLDEIPFRPWISYFRFTQPDLSKLSLLRFDDNGTGKGYPSLMD